MFGDLLHTILRLDFAADIWMQSRSFARRCEPVYLILNFFSGSTFHAVDDIPYAQILIHNTFHRSAHCLEPWTSLGALCDEMNKLGL